MSVKGSGYKTIMSHDIDFVTKFRSMRSVLSAWSRGENNPVEGYRQLRRSRKYRSSDPYWAMMEMLEINLSAGIETHFYFKTAITNPRYDWNDYAVEDKDVRQLIRELLSGGAVIGLHPSYETYLDYEQIRLEKDRLEQILGQAVVHSRQHFLRYQFPETFVHLAKAGIRHDSSIMIGSPDCRSAHGHPYMMTHAGQALGIVEHPILFMETHMIHDSEAVLTTLAGKLETIKKEQGQAMVIWHNNNFETTKQQQLYRQVVSLMAA